MDTEKVSDPTGFWTNERHMQYLNSMEASFVRTMLGNGAGSHLRLDRYMPDSSESTLDLKKERQRRHSTSDIPHQRSCRNTTDKKTRRLSFETNASSQDQVVPQVESEDKEVRGQL